MRACVASGVAPLAILPVIPPAPRIANHTPFLSMTASSPFCAFHLSHLQLRTSRTDRGGNWFDKLDVWYAKDDKSDYKTACPLGLQPGKMHAGSLRLSKVAR